MTVLPVLVGVALLLCGRQLFWLFVGGVGFVAGLAAATDLFPHRPEWMVLLIAMAAGILGAVLSIFLQRFAIGLAGFFAGGYALLNLAGKSGREDWAWIGFVVGGIIGSLLVLVLFDWALIALSALTGATLVVDNISLDPAASLLVWLALFVVGCGAQGATIRRQRSRPIESGK